MDLMQSEAFAQHSTTWADLATLLKQRFLLVVLVVLMTVLTAYSALQFLTERYETSVRLLVKLGRENTEVPLTVQKSNFFSTGIRKEEVNSEVLLLASRPLIEATVEKIGLEAFQREPPPPQTLLQRIKFVAKQGVKWTKQQLDLFLIAANLRKQLSKREEVILGIEGALKVEVEKNSDVIVARLRWPDPELAVQVLDTLVQLYLDQRILVRRPGNVKQFFDEQVAQRKKQLLDLETAREETKTKWNLIVAAQQRTLLLEQLHRLQERIFTSENDRSALQAQHKALRARLTTIADEVRSSHVVTPNPALQSIKERLTTLELQRVESLNRYTPESQVIRNLDQAITALRDKMASEERTTIGAVTLQTNPLKQTLAQQAQDLEIKLSGAEASIQQLRTEVTAIEERLRRLTTGERQLELIERERQIAETNYLNYVKTRDEARMAEAMDVNRFANIAILSPAERPIEPVYPRKMLLMLVSLPVGVLLGTALAFILAYMNDVIRTPRDLAQMEAFPYLGTFHLQPTAAPGRHADQREPTYVP